jgi:nucleoside-diphosphate-sugar epimerase
MCGGAEVEPDDRDALVGQEPSRPGADAAEDAGDEEPLRQASLRDSFPAMAIVVTGGSGKAGRAVVRELVDYGADVLSVDLVRSPELPCRQLQADLTDFGEAVEALRGAESVVHLAAIPAPGLRPDELTFRVNTTSTYNVFSAAAQHGLRRVVWASSETVLGLPFERERPAYAPIDEEHPAYPEYSYALSKLISEELARQFSRWTGIPFVGLRFSNVIEPADYVQFPTFWQDPLLRKWNLWGYVDVRDVAQACRLAVESDLAGAEVFIVAAADTVMTRPSLDLLAEVFPEVPVKGEVGELETLLSIAKARRLLGYEPAFSWRDHVPEGNR